MNADIPKWLDWARTIQSLSQTGLTFSRNEFEVDRNRKLMEVAAEITEHHTRLLKIPVLENFLIQPGYATPKVDVRGAVIRAKKILLVQEHSDKRWSMPGGWADVGETPSEMVIREVQEESGFHVIPSKVIGVYDANRGGVPLDFYHAYKIVFLCEITGGEARSSNETLDVGFFDFEHLPELSSARTNKRHIHDILCHMENPGLPAFFD